MLMENGTLGIIEMSKQNKLPLVDYLIGMRQVSPAGEISYDDDGKHADQDSPHFTRVYKQLKAADVFFDAYSSAISFIHSESTKDEFPLKVSMFSHFATPMERRIKELSYEDKLWLVIEILVPISESCSLSSPSTISLSALANHFLGPPSDAPVSGLITSEPSSRLAMQINCSVPQTTFPLHNDSYADGLDDCHSTIEADSKSLLPQPLARLPSDFWRLHISVLPMLDNELSVLPPKTPSESTLITHLSGNFLGTSTKEPLHDSSYSDVQAGEHSFVFTHTEGWFDAEFKPFSSKLVYPDIFFFIIIYSCRRLILPPSWTRLVTQHRAHPTSRSSIISHSAPSCSHHSDDSYHLDIGAPKTDAITATCSNLSCPLQPLCLEVVVSLELISPDCMSCLIKMNDNEVSSKDDSRKLAWLELNRLAGLPEMQPGRSYKYM
ncbi:unnamed protein product [Protopolystoma xenopodis]|uniref:Uncharacterized protein n=1 Tax=Protopolystoma xenopodis TaxID=117903 RepID=A0A3S5CJ76_9PLAT|nr:unnamed protein product [Protopolystoma xenopodis]